MVTESLVSHVDNDSPIAAIEPDDWKKIEGQLQTYLPQILFDLYSTDFDELSTYFESSPNLKQYQKILKIDEASRKLQQKFTLPDSNKALSSFKQFTYGGPGFGEYLNHFMKTICIPLTRLLESSKKNNTMVSDSVSSNITFDSPNLSLLPDEIFVGANGILTNFTPKQLLLLMCVNKHFNRLARDERLWKKNFNFMQGPSKLETSLYFFHRGPRAQFMNGEITWDQIQSANQKAIKAYEENPPKEGTPERQHWARHFAGKAKKPSCFTVTDDFDAAQAEMEYYYY